ncbi:hypothetical protein AB290_12715 [Listeria monocytogenes]|uniref:hypothetical protein n=1 Tax=Listeria monocytogenes TaxID=1639 RepID=UPI0010EA5FFA|nr:hypothetical protein [Listeria monocytogenes]EAD7632777.1 hypothetical protein [Listeria monocytogenes]
MLTVVIIKSDAASLFQQKEMSLHDFIVGTVSLENGESFEVELLNPQHAPFYKVTYTPTLEGPFDTFLLQRFKELRKQKHLDKASHDVFVKWVKASCSEESSSLGQANLPVKATKPVKKTTTISERQTPENENASVVKEKVRPSKKRKQLPNVINIVKDRIRDCPRFHPSRKVIIGVVSVLLLLSIAVGGGVTIAQFTQSKTEAKEAKKASFDQLLADKSYEKMYTDYPNQFWAWEESCVKELDSKQLVAAYEAVPELSIAYDLAFVEKAYDKVVNFYETKAAEMEVTTTRQDFAAYSYLQLGNLTTAEKTATSETSTVFYEALGWAYLAKGDVKKAEEIQVKAASQTLDQQIKDYQLVHTTLQEVEKQLKRKELSTNLRKELEQSKQDLTEQLEILKKKPREESEEV